MIAGTPHARRREWSLLRSAVRLPGAPEPLARFLGVGYSVVATGTHTRKIRARQEEYIGSILEKHDSVAPFKAGPRATPAVRRGDVCERSGDRAVDCRMHIGSLMYVVRASRPGATHPVNRVARKATS